MGLLGWASRTLATGMLPGLITGLIVGGVGSRVAMRVMAMTSPAARGAETDFEATVGEITPGGNGSFLVSSDNPDFVILTPAALAVAMFAALPLVYGLVFVLLAERLEPMITGVRRPVLLIVPVVVGLLPLILLGGAGLIVIAGVILVWAIGDSIGARQRHVLRYAAYVLVGALVVWRGVVFITGVAEIL
jgi:hypothetical protein